MPVPNCPPDFHALGSAFGIAGKLIDSVPHGSGHINDTFAATYSSGGGVTRYIHQRINQSIFTDPAALMDNIARVTRHTRSELERRAAAEPSRRTLTVVASREGKPLVRDADGGTWRTYLFIERAVAYDKIETAQQAREAARAFGEFQGFLIDLPGARLHETIRNFHHTRSRYEALVAAVRADAHGRVAAAREEIAFAAKREPMVDRLLDLQAQGELPERITHNDTKLNNVMFDAKSGEAICVVDLDTVMPGLALYDFGDMVRTATSPALEDETDLSKVTMQMPMFEALASGYMAATSPFLLPQEKALLAFSGKLISFEIGLRFLTDFLEGDTYFKTKRATHNLDRCRTQFKLVESIEGQESAMQRFVERL